MNHELHISSLLVQHRTEALPTLRSFIETCAELELALNEGTRSVVLCETDHQRATMDHIDAMQALPGVLSVSLIYHHAEPRQALDQTVSVALRGVAA
ncbi:chaperone NapD [Dyella sp.]|uniref:chaperone NapD n=1 Tax=Dyella sp. TaxID=1869338 RepID=UPI002ED69463